MIMSILALIGAITVLMYVRSNRSLKGVIDFLKDEIMDLEDDIREVFDWDEEE